MVSLIYLGASCLLALILSMITFVQTGSLLVAIAVYSAAGMLVLTGVLLMGFVRQDADQESDTDTALYPAE